MRLVNPAKFGDRRRSILDAAQRCFARDGLMGASTAAICAEAGISPGHLYHYFKSKDLIMEAIADADLVAKTERLTRTIAEKTSVVVALESLVDMYLGPSPNHEGALLFDVLAEARRRPALSHSLNVRSIELRGLIEDLIIHGQASGELLDNISAPSWATSFVAVLDGLKALAVRGLDGAAAAVEIKQRYLHVLAGAPARADSRR